FHAPPFNKQHPMHCEHHDTPSKLKLYIRGTLRPLLNLATPIQADVWWRMLYRMLPVNYTLFFLQSQQPHIMECVYPGCSAVETMRHALVECACVCSVWTWHSASWRQFGLEFSWSKLSDLDQVAVHPRWQHMEEPLRKLWVMLAAVVLHTMWTHRNKTRFEDKPPPFVPAVRHSSLVSWSASVRRLLRDPSVDDTDRLHIATALSLLGQHTHYSWFWAQNPWAFSPPSWASPPP
ncbi:hypothetical protein H310_15410, partial [Aphanomyces invadans]